MQAGESPDHSAHWAIAYFRSGWAFLLPYTLVYFAYAALKWPVNPVGAGGNEQGAGILGGGISLLHIYWALHAIHAVLGAAALRLWWKGQKQNAMTQSPPASVLPSPASRALASALPWLGLALLFWIPGVYLEFPADPWQHLARTNEWVWLTRVTEHSYWAKSSYFLAYSFVGRVDSPLTELRWFDVYYTGCCLLLCWQYYRLARAVGLGERAALLFVLLNTLTFGNNLFGFYRYYGMSSAIFAQVGAVAVVRILLAAIGSNDQGSASDVLPRPLVSRDRLHLAFALGFALVVTAGNHKQGIILAGTGSLAVICWRLVAWRRAMIGWLLLAATLTSLATVLWWPRQPLLDASFRPNGWLNAWYGFNLLQLSSPAFQRAWVIIGAIGGINLAAGLWLLRRNHVAAWLTWMPFVLLLLPCFAVPFANVLATSTDLESGYVIAFHRALLATPAGLALVAALADRGMVGQKLHPRRLVAICTLAAVAAFMVAPASGPAFNRMYHLLAVPPADLCMAGPTKALAAESGDQRSNYRLATHQGIAFVAASIGWRKAIYAQKNQMLPSANTVNWAIDEFRFSVAGQEPVIAYFPPFADLYTSESEIGRLSGHWSVQRVHREYVYGPAIDMRLIHAGARRVSTANGTWYYVGGADFSPNLK